MKEFDTLEMANNYITSFLASEDIEVLSDDVIMIDDDYCRKIYYKKKEYKFYSYGRLAVIQFSCLKENQFKISHDSFIKSDFEKFKELGCLDELA